MHGTMSKVLSPCSTFDMDAGDSSYVFMLELQVFHLLSQISRPWEIVDDPKGVILVSINSQGHTT